MKFSYEKLRKLNNNLINQYRYDKDNGQCIAIVEFSYICYKHVHLYLNNNYETTFEQYSRD